jgi:SAM-dependent methyltransferase
MASKEWFASWFDTKYYHLLYRERDDNEARRFIENLLSHLKLPTNSHVLDLACGKGRHSITLNNFGMNVLGVDLSEQSIAHAKQFENDKLHFRVQDMREPFEEEAFDCVFNLFTSFGYFEEEVENQRVLNGISRMMKDDGLFVFDYLNTQTAVNGLVSHEEKEIDNVHFNITRNFDGEFIRKKIEVTTCEAQHQFEEKVRGFDHKEIEKMLVKANLIPKEYFGDFDLSAFDPQKSNRLIVICTKKTTL